MNTCGNFYDIDTVAGGPDPFTAFMSNSETILLPSRLVCHWSFHFAKVSDFCSLLVSHSPHCSFCRLTLPGIS